MTTEQVRIVSDGTAAGTRVYAGDVELDGWQITGVSWSIGKTAPAANGLAFATIDLHEVPVELVGERHQ